MQQEPIRVAQVLNRMDSGGIEAVVMNYYRHVDRAKIQFDFYFAQDSAFPQRAELERLGAGIYPVPPYTQILAYHRALFQAFKLRRYKIVHAHVNTMSVFPLFAAWRAGVPVRICHNHSTAHWGEGKKTLLKYLLRPFCRVFATDYFACGEKAGRWMYGRRCFEKGKVRILPNAIDPKRFAYDAAARARLRRELGIPQDAFVVGHVGRFTYAKNQDFLLRIFADFCHESPNSRLLLVGEGELEATLREQAKKLGVLQNAIFTGSRSDVDKLYSAMDVFCLPSFYEGLPVVAVEAQANGLPCIFSVHVDREAVLSPSGERLALERDLWRDRLQHMQVRPAGEKAHALAEEWDIQTKAAQLETYYKTKSEQ